MNTVLTHAALGVTALAIGGAAGYFIGKKRAQKEADAIIAAGNEYWRSRIEELEGASAIITFGEDIETPTGEDGNKDWTQSSSVNFSESMLVKEGETELLPDFPEDDEAVADDFTVEGEAPSVDALKFIEQFKNRTSNDFGGVSFPGQVDDEYTDAEVADVPLRTVPDFVVVRDPNAPYVISIDDFMDPATDPPFTKVEMRYFKGDNVVVDARDVMVPMSTLGQHNTLRFGEGTTDPSQVYIRNERFGLDIELTLEEGLYVHEVLGQDFADKSPIHKMRESDDS